MVKVVCTKRNLIQPLKPRFYIAIVLNKYQWKAKSIYLRQANKNKIVKEIRRFT